MVGSLMIMGIRAFDYRLLVIYIEKKATENTVNLFSRLTYFQLLSTNRHILTLLPEAQTLGIF